VTILDDILARKRTELAQAWARVSPAEMERRARGRDDPIRGLRAGLASQASPSILAEIKRRSPSRGEIRPDFDPVACARAYQEGGAAALSVLTDFASFGGELAFLDAIRPHVSLPILRKDFVLDPYQVDETRACGGDAVLLIVAALSAESLAALQTRARARGLDALVEVHDEAELEVALAAGADLVGINHRDLRTFEVDLSLSERLAPRVPEGVLVVAESGIFTHDHVLQLERAGARAFLVGESLMREPDLVQALRKLRGAA
jgi:indole-3-glycerol phosphate synthase